jgi:hypothetical protein
MDHICKRCFTIPWATLSQVSFYHVLFTIDETEGKWHVSSCRVCHLSKKARPDWYLYDEKMQMLWTPHQIDVNGIGTINFSTKRSSKCEISTRGIDVVYFKPEVSQDLLRQWNSKYTDFSLLRSWIDSCRSSHQSCEPMMQTSLVDLREIDCKLETVIQAPPDCS